MPASIPLMQQQVYDFHYALAATIGETPAYRDQDLRRRIIAEEIGEVCQSLREGDFANLIKEICDLLYVVYGTGVVFGVPLFSRLDKPRAVIGTPRLVATALAERRLRASTERALTAMAERSLPVTIRALQRLLNVIEYWVWRWHIPLAYFFDAVHQSNMAKLGGPVRADGKILKPTGWQPPPMSDMLDRLLEAGRGSS